MPRPSRGPWQEDGPRISPTADAPRWGGIRGGGSASARRSPPWWRIGSRPSLALVPWEVWWQAASPPEPTLAGGRRSRWEGIRGGGSAPGPPVARSRGCGSASAPALRSSCCHAVCVGGGIHDCFDHQEDQGPYIIVKATELIKLLSRSIPAPQAMKILDD